jgi:FkbM family methyltransferase
LRLPLCIDRASFDLGPASQDTFLKGLLWLGAYETLERYAIAKYITRTTPVVELGAALGVVSCLTNRNLENPTRHVVVEANPALISALEANRERNRCGFRVVHGVLAYLAPSATFNVSASIVASSVGGQIATNPVVVPTVGLQQLVADAGFDRCTLVCDIEGSEAELVKHEGHVLRDRVETLFLEIHAEQLGAEGVAALHFNLNRIGFAAIWSRGDVWVFRNRRTDY